MGKTYSCTVEGCEKVFSRQFEIRKHKVLHEDPDKLFYCTNCDFYSLDRRNLKVHIATHTGEKIHGCPDTVQVDGPSGKVEEPCTFRTSDPSLLTKHRMKAHGYIPREHPTRQRGEAFTFVYYPVLSFASTDDTTTRAGKSRRVKKRNATNKASKSSRTRKGKDSTSNAEQAALDSSSPSTSQQGLSEREQIAHVASPDASGSSSIASSSIVSPVPDQHALLDVLGLEHVYAGSPNVAGTPSTSSSDTTSSLDTHGQSANVGSSHAEYFRSITPVAPNQTLTAQHQLLFSPNTNYDWLFTDSSAQNLQMNGLDGPDEWRESNWIDFWRNYNSITLT